MQIRDFVTNDVAVLSVNFIDGGIVEITFLETRDQTDKAGVLKTIALDAEEFNTAAQQLHDDIVDLLDAGLEYIRLHRS